MSPINKLGLRIAGITFFVIIIIYGIFWGGRYIFESATNTDNQQEPTKQPAVTPSASPLLNMNDKTDSDGDGIPDVYEKVYGTNPNSADTNNNGVNDLQELMLGKNPAVPGPSNDIKPLTGAQAVDTSTFTGKYLSTLPETVSRDDVLNQKNLQAFVNANEGQILPDISSLPITTTSAKGKDAVKAYLDAISPTQNKQLTAVTSDDISAAFQKQSSDPKALQNILASLKKNMDILKQATVPAEVLDLHKKYLAASQGLIDNVTLLTQMQTDFVAGLEGAKKIGDLAPTFDDIAKQIAALESKYKL